MSQLTNFGWDHHSVSKYVDYFENSDYYDPLICNTTKSYVEKFVEYLNGVSNGTIDDDGVDDYDFY